jgi:hypothetical protein
MNNVQILPLFRRRMLNLLDCRLVSHPLRPSVFSLFWRKKGKWGREKREEGRKKEERGRGNEEGNGGEQGYNRQPSQPEGLTLLAPRFSSGPLGT